MRVYLCARYSRIEEMRCVARDLDDLGYEVTSRWILGNHQLDDEGLSLEATAEERARFAREDWQDLKGADIVISFTESPRSSNSRGGRHVELGAALAWGKPCVIVGPRENVFHYRPEIAVFAVWGQIYAVLAAMAPQHRKEVAS